MKLPKEKIENFFDIEIASNTAEYLVAPLSQTGRSLIVFSNGNSIEFSHLKESIIISGLPRKQKVLDKNGNFVLGFGEFAKLNFFRLLDSEITKAETDSYSDPSKWPQADIAQSARIHHTAEIGANTVIDHGVVIKANVKVGENSYIGPNSVLGHWGFGVVKDENQMNFRLPQIGGVNIGNNVWIGAHNTIASGTLNATVVEDFVNTDDHVHIAHNVEVGSNCIITACAEISGSVKIGQNCWLGPNCSIMNKISIGDGAVIGLGACVLKSVEARAIMVGNPAKRIKRN